MLRKSPKYLPRNGLNAYGFTLIELMVVVAIIGVLASIAYPSYMSSVQKSKRTGAKVAIMEVAQAQERYFSLNMRYADSMLTLGLGDADEYGISVSGLQSNGSTACSAINCVTYTIKAKVKTGVSQANDSPCQLFTLTHTGVQAANNAIDGTGTDTSTTCW